MNSQSLNLAEVPEPDRIRTILKQVLTDSGLVDAYERMENNPQSYPSFCEQAAQKLGCSLLMVGSALGTSCDEYLKRHTITLSEAELDQFAELLVLKFGFGPLTPLINDPAVYEIMVNGPQHIFVERKGRLQKVDHTFESISQITETIDRLLSLLGEHLDVHRPIIDARFPDGTLINVTIPPVALNGPCLTIRKFVGEQLTIADLIRFGSLSSEMADFLKACIVSRFNVFVSGGTGSGKMTVTEILMSFIPEDERVITIEDIPFFHPQRDHIVSLQSQPPDRHGQGEVTLQDLVRTASRMRPERIIIGEFQGPEILEVMRVITRGHDGSMATVFASSPLEALEQVELLVKFHHPDIPATYLRSFIASAVDFVVQVTRLPDGTRKITHITEVLPVREEGYYLQNVFHFQRTDLNEQGKIVGEFCSNLVSKQREQRFRRLDIFLPGVMRAEAES